MVNIYMKESVDGGWIRALNIPQEDIARLSLRPLKWLRFVAFAVLGAKGDLFDGPVPGSNIVNYESVLHAELAENYYYFVPDGMYRLADNGLNDHVTSSITLQRIPTYHRNVARRDGNRCAITGEAGHRCHAAHIIAHCKGEEYIQFVVSDRSSLYEDQRSHLKNIGIDSTENGIFLSANLHSRFGQGDSVFLKTPNFALSPGDIPRVKPGETPASRTTIQHIIPYDEAELHPVPEWDVRADWSGGDEPPNLLLDYVYGIAAMRRWAAPDIQNMLNSRHETDYKNVSKTLPSSNSNTGIESDGTTDTSGEFKLSKRDLKQSQAMDFAFQLSMFFRGYPPGTTWQMLRQRQVEEAEIRSRQIAQEKVQEWLKTGSGAS